MIRYLGFEIKVHGLNFTTKEQIQKFKDQVYHQILAIHPNLSFTNDVEVELVEQAGKDHK